MLKEKNISDLPGALLTTDSKGHITFCSDSLLKHLRYKSPDQLKNRSLKFLFEKGKLPDIKRGLKYSHNEKGYRITTARCIAGTGDTVPIDFFIPEVKGSWWKNRHIFILTGSPFSNFARSKELVYAIFNQARKSRNLLQLLHFVYAQLSELIDTKNFYIALYDEKTDEYSFPVYHDEFDEYESWTPVKLPASLTDYVRKSNKPLLITDHNRDSIMKRTKLKSQGTKSRQWIGVPLKNSNNKAAGIIAIQSYDKTDIYTYEDIELLEFVADNIGATIDKIRSEEENKRLYLIVEQSEDLFATITPEGGLRYINGAGRKFIGIDNLKELKGNFFDNFMSPEEQEIMFAQLNSEGVWKGELIITNSRSGKQIKTLATISAIKESSSPYPYFSVTMKDLTGIIASEEKRKSLEEQLFHARKMEAIGTLAGGIAHDFNNILGAIIGFAELASESPPNSQLTPAYLEKIIKASERARDMTKQILAFSRKTRIKHQPVNMVDIVKETIKLLKSTTPSNIKFRTRFKKEYPFIKGDPAQMVQVIINICTNAAHSMIKSGGIVGISLKEEQRSGTERLLELKIKDSGEGMDPQTLSRVFEPYFTTKPLGEGTGMGLAVVHGIVLNHDGHISIESVPGEGTEVRILLPCISAGNIEQAGKRSVISKKNIGHILLIEDEELLIDIVKQHLESVGFKVTAFESGREALVFFVNNRRTVDLIFTDQMLPDISGTEIISEAAKIHPGISSVITTGYNSIINEDNFADFGASRFLMKPFSKKELLDTVQLALKK